MGAGESVALFRCQPEHALTDCLHTERSPSDWSNVAECPWPGAVSASTSSQAGTPSVPERR